VDEEEDDNDHICFAMGNCLSKLGMVDEAIEFYKKALKSNPKEL
jgi:tetratricopeptide (TPR) repeat protein